MEPPADGLQVQVVNESRVEVDVPQIEAAVEAALQEAPYESIAISVAVVDDEAMHNLNRQFLDHDYPTDVLSFPLEETPQRLEGEIIVSVDTAARCAAEAGWSAAEELLLYIVHGALHLAGYRDKNPQDAAEMRSAELAVLAQIGVRVSAQDSRWRAGQEDESP